MDSFAGFPDPTPFGGGKTLAIYSCTSDLYGPLRYVFDGYRYFTRASRRGLGTGNLEFCLICPPFWVSF